MAKPIVRLLLVATRVGNEPPDNDLVVRNPMAVVTAAPGERLPLREPEISVYVELCGGLGRWELAVEFGQRLDTGVFRTVKTSPGDVLAFGPNARLAVWQWWATFQNVPLREGLYEFRVVSRPADRPETGYEVLDGTRPGVPATAELRVLDGGGRL